VVEGDERFRDPEGGPVAGEGVRFADQQAAVQQDVQRMGEIA
jgi:hypothetical protein